MISFIEAWKIIKNLDLSNEKKTIVVDNTSDLGFFGKLFLKCTVSRLSPQFLTERN